jgi:hypothetical protein
MIATQLIQREPDKSFIDWLIQIGRNGACDLLSRVAAIASVPNQGRRLIQAMGAVTIKIVNQGLIGQSLDD